MILHRALGERLFTDEEITHEDGVSVFGEGWAADGWARSERLSSAPRQPGRHCRAVSSRTSSNTSRRTAERRPCEANGARLASRRRLRVSGRVRRHTHAQRYACARARQQAGQIRTASEIICYCAEKRRHGPWSVSLFVLTGAGQGQARIMGVDLCHCSVVLPSQPHPRRTDELLQSCGSQGCSEP